MARGPVHHIVARGEVKGIRSRTQAVGEFEVIPIGDQGEGSCNYCGRRRIVLQIMTDEKHAQSLAAMLGGTLERGGIRNWWWSYRRSAQPCRAAQQGGRTPQEGTPVHSFRPVFITPNLISEERSPEPTLRHGRNKTPR